MQQDFRRGPAAHGAAPEIERALLREGKQYEYLWAEVEDTEGTIIPAVTYKVSHAARDGRPSRTYLNLILEAARQRGLPDDYISSIEGVEARE